MSPRLGQRLERISYRLYERPVHPELFDLAEQTPRFKTGPDASIWLANQGHIISVHHEELTLTEVFIDPDCELPTRGRLDSWVPRGEKEIDRLYCGRIRYRMICQVEAMRPKVYAAMHKDVLAKGQTRGLYAAFPDRISDRGVIPFSWIDYEVTSQTLHAFSYHAFPAELAMLKVQTLIELPA